MGNQKKLLSNIMLQNELESEAASFITTFKLVLQQASWVNTNFWLDHFTRESRHTRDLRT